MFLKTLCELNGVSGNEKTVREFILGELKDKIDTYSIDKIGNLLVHKKSRAAAEAKNPKVALCAHMDEVGLFITDITAEGYLKFQTVGGIDPRILLAKTVLCAGDVPGVIGSKAVHLQKPEERKQIIAIDDLYIDIGASNKEEAENVVKIGGFVAFTSEFNDTFGCGLYKGKALDDRAGCAIILELLADEYPCDLWGVFTVQEELGLRGSKVIGNHFQADLAIIIEATAAKDQAETPPEEWVVQLGKGPACSLMDGTTIYRPELIQKTAEMARKMEIPLQFRQGTASGNDAGNIQRSGQGIPTLTLSIPCRNIHSMSSLISAEDYDNCRKLVRSILENAPDFCAES